MQRMPASTTATGRANGPTISGGSPGATCDTPSIINDRARGTKSQSSRLPARNPPFSQTDTAVLIAAAPVTTRSVSRAERAFPGIGV
ncbi:hypothetical protein GCM10022255_078460 [Dactylosporangium darangshiense]|uniref:Uncharacterized protein n=1 Tax=Dactylosporangium darangshiense TaxID=579108 RepID=A0ABP8DKH4_9ACTN